MRVLCVNKLILQSYNFQERMMAMHKVNKIIARRNYFQEFYLVRINHNFDKTLLKIHG